MRLGLAIALPAFCIPTAVRAQQPEDPGVTQALGQPSPPGLVSLPGVGARALGMGGAFTAIADDATAATWNPAGLSRLTQPEASLVFEASETDREVVDFSYGYDQTFGLDFFPLLLEDSESYAESFSRHSASGDAQEPTFVSATYPLQAGGRNFVLQFSARKVLLPASYEEKSGVDWSSLYVSRVLFFDDAAGDFVELFREEFPASGEDSYRLQQDLDNGIDTFTISIASALTETFSAGLSVNYVRGRITETTDLQIDYTYPLYFGYPIGYGTFIEHTRQEQEFSDWTLDVGILWRPVREISVGAVWRTAQEDSVDITTQSRFSVITTDVINDTVSDSGESTERREGDFRWPSGWVVGLAVMPIDWLTLAVDYGRTDWSDGELRHTDGDPGGGSVPSLGPQREAVALRVGTEVRIPVAFGIIPIRAGYSEEETLAAPGTTSAFFADAVETILISSERRYSPVQSVSLGTGIAVTGTKFSYQVDVAWVRSVSEEAFTNRFVDTYDDGLFFYDVDEVASRKDEVTTDRWILSAVFRF